MSFLTCSIIVVLGCVFSQNAEAIVNPSAALEVYPYFSPMGYRRPDYFSTETDQKLLSIASQYGINPANMYQLYEILNSYTALTIDQDINILRRVAELIDRRRRRYGLTPRSYYGNYFVPNPPSLNMMTRRDPQVISGLMRDVSSNLSGAYQNMKDTASYYLPNLTYGLNKEWNDIMGAEIPRDIASGVSNLTSQMTRTMGNMLSDLF